MQYNTANFNRLTFSYTEDGPQLKVWADGRTQR